MDILWRAQSLGVERDTRRIFLHTSDQPISSGKPGEIISRIKTSNSSGRSMRVLLRLVRQTSETHVSKEDFRKPTKSKSSVNRFSLKFPIEIEASMLSIWFACSKPNSLVKELEEHYLNALLK